MNIGLIYIVLSEFFWAGELLLVRKYFPNANPVFMTAMTSIVAAVFYLPTVFVYKQRFSLFEWLIIIVLGLFSFGVAQILYIKGIQNGPSAFSIAVATLTLPMLSALMSLIFFKEPITLRVIVGAGLMIVGFLIVSLK